MKKMSMFFILIMSMSNAHALTTTINGTTYSCEPIDVNPYPYPPVQKSHYCTMESSFDGSFGAGGSTELEARRNVKAACKAGSRSNGFFCDEATIICDSSY